MIGLPLAVRQAGEEDVSRADIVAVGSSSSRRCTDNLKQVHGSSPLQCYVDSKAGSHHVTATNGLESLRSCSLSDVTVEGNLYNLRPLDVSISEYGREIKDGIICPIVSISTANCSCHRV